MVLSSTLRLRNSCPMADFRVECLTYARSHCPMADFRVECLTYERSHARPVPSLTSPGYGLSPTTTIPARRLLNIERPSRLETRTFLTGTCAPTTRTSTLYRLSYGTGIIRSSCSHFRSFHILNIIFILLQIYFVFFYSI